MDLGGVKLGGVVLCGGRSSRMGASKAMLPFGPERMLARIVRLLSAEASPIVVVAAADQELPPLSSEVLVVRDERRYQGPLEGLRLGLETLEGRCDAAYATGCDVPFLAGRFVRRMAELLGDFQIAMPFVAGFHHPLAAVYRLSVRRAIEALIAAERWRPVFLIEAVPTRIVEAGELFDIDPSLDTLKNLNQPDDYLNALAAAGFTCPPDVLEKLAAES